MKRFRPADFSNLDGSKLAKSFAPIASAWKLQDIRIDDLAARRKKLILLDVDNTLTKWKSEEIADEVRTWLDEARASGFKIAILSNTRHPERLHRLSAQLDIPTVSGRMKPSRSMYLRALTEFGVTAEAAVMIGDQILTDVFGANRSGIEAIWLHPLSDTEFIGTKVNRWIEDRIVTSLFAALETPIDAHVHGPAGAQGTLRQVMRFCIVGGVSFVIDTTISIILETVVRVHGVLLSEIFGTWLMHQMPVVFGTTGDPKDAAAKIFFWIAALAAMTNSFFFNRLWTFGIKGDADRMLQMRRFFVVSLLGTGLNTLVASHVFALLGSESARDTTIAKAAAAVIVACWNFCGQRFYAFRRPQEPRA